MTTEWSQQQKEIRMSKTTEAGTCRCVATPVKTSAFHGMLEQGKVYTYERKEKVSLEWYLINGKDVMSVPAFESYCRPVSEAAKEAGAW